jgi:polyhydroxyalkanoate synthesis repressor PhaR
MPPKTLIIKKYENRRLYNTATSQYINQEQVAQLVRDGRDVRVVDAATGEDLTRLILAQIVVEDAKAPDSVFPLDMLRQMIVASGRATQESALHYMKSMMEMYQNAFRAVPPAVNPIEFMRWPQPATTAPPPPAQAEASEESAHKERRRAGKTGTEKKAAEVEELKRRIAELEAASGRRQKPKNAQGKTGPRRKS